jgi:hypothetical protein
MKEASRACRAYIREHDLTMHNWSGGKVTQNGRVVARVTYNGRVWTPEPWPHCTEVVL